jgi:hypothetical protein
MLKLNGDRTLQPARAASIARNAIRIDLATVLAAMRDLQEATKMIPHRVLYLDLYTRSDRNSVTLRWRDGRGRLVGNERWTTFAASLPVKLRRWYGDVDRQAAWLNTQERIYRHAWNELTALTQGTLHHADATASELTP